MRKQNDLIRMRDKLQSEISRIESGIRKKQFSWNEIFIHSNGYASADKYTVRETLISFKDQLQIINWILHADQVN